METFYGLFRLIRQMFEKNQWQTPRLTGYAQGLTDFSDTAQTIFDKIRNGRIDTDASRELRKVRGQIAKHEAELKKSLFKVFARSTTITRCTNHSKMIATHYLCAPNFNIRSKGRLLNAPINGQQFSLNQKQRFA